jgi:hypothetical protein
VHQLLDYGGAGIGYQKSRIDVSRYEQIDRGTPTYLMVVGG